MERKRDEVPAAWWHAVGARGERKRVGAKPRRGVLVGSARGWSPLHVPPCANVPISKLCASLQPTRAGGIVPVDEPMWRTLGAWGVSSTSLLQGKVRVPGKGRESCHSLLHPLEVGLWAGRVWHRHRPWIRRREGRRRCRRCRQRKPDHTGAGDHRDSKDTRLAWYK